ncbi:armadillo repeat protein [Xylariaceae sp. FL1272]|nr:armadillo repeat protein [Xylariaceae sp. FL1272]
MALDPQSLLAQLNATPSSRNAALRSLKNEIIGDIQKKKVWVRHGVVPHIVRVLHATTRDTSAHPRRQSFLAQSPFSDDETAQLQALQLLASFSTAGPAFLFPLYASGALQAVLSPSCLQNDRSNIVLAALRVLKGIAVAAPSASTSSPINPISLADLIFGNAHLPSLLKILAPTERSTVSESQILIVAFLIRRLCREETHQNALVEGGILDALATKLATFAVAEGHVLPGAEVRAKMEGLDKYIPQPASNSASLDEVLGAIAAIVTDSPFRASKLLYSPSILAIFPNFANARSSKPNSPPEFIILPGLSPTRPRESEMDFLLPFTPPYTRGHGRHHHTAASTGTPVSKDSSGTNGRPSSKLQSTHVSWTPPEETAPRTTEATSSEVESPLVPWLIHLVRTRKGTESLMAASVLTSLFKTGCAYNKVREQTVGLLVVPVLLWLLEDAETQAKESPAESPNRDTMAKISVLEEAPAVLSRLITDSEHLQKAAFDCNAVKTICRLFKGSFNTSFATVESHPWSPHGSSNENMDGLGPECRLGDDGQHPQLIHQMRLRESALRALGALAIFKEEYRKAIVQQDAIPCIVDCLGQPESSATEQAKDYTVSNRRKARFENNTSSILVAACYCVRMLSRSVSTLRTAMIDHGASKPLLKLLVDDDIEVKIAATQCLINLLPEFSPTRESLVEAGIASVLIGHAHSDNPGLRLEALWALKHLVDSASVDLKKSCIEGLDPDWLFKVICDDTEGDRLSFSAPRIPLTSVMTEDMDEDVDMGVVDEQTYSWPTSSCNKTTPPSSRARSDVRILRLADSRLTDLKESEFSPVRKARADNLSIQEQGLQLIRNLIGGSDSIGGPPTASRDTAEMIEYIFKALGQQRFFDMLASKLRPKVLHPFNRRGTSGSEKTRILPPQNRIIESVLWILVHIAAGEPHYRQLIIAQTEMLKQILKLFSSTAGQVRLALCQLMNNLTWQDDHLDAVGSSQRAMELKSMGFDRKLENLRTDDEELDVRERAKSAVWQMQAGYHS